MMNLRDTTLGALIDALAAKTPAPGGGAAAAVVAGVAAALATMVVNYSLNRKKQAEHQTLLAECAVRLSRLRDDSLALARDDMEAYERLNALQRLDPADPERLAGWTAAVDRAIDVPSRAVSAAMETLRIAQSLAGRSNEWLRSDLAIAAVLAEAAATAAAWNVRVNLPLLDHPARRDAIEHDLDRFLTEAGSIRRTVEAACR
jgi:formiminotetrahydrofolate cyclodeaminase